MIVKQIFLITCFVLNAWCQNLDILTNIYSGKFISMAGAGIALADGNSSVDINPAGLVYTKNSALSISQYVDYHRYSLFNVREEENYSRLFEWSKFNATLQSLLISYQLNNKLSIAIGYLNRINPYIYNEQRAITWSPLFNQETSGGINTLVLSSAYKLLDNISIGLSAYLYFGSIVSSVHGENHGNDVDKWAELKNTFSGKGLKIGIKYKYKNIKTGFVFEIPHILEAKSKINISDDQLYSYLLPDKNKSNYNMPLNIGLGIAYSINTEWTIAIDYEFRDYNDSETQINLFEYGGEPNWKDIRIYRIGVEYIDPADEWIPIRIGYAYIPQLYASNESTGNWVYSKTYKDKNQNLINLFTIGTSFYFNQFELNLNFKYSFLKWRRNFYTYITVDEDYQEDVFGIGSELIYYF